MISFPQEVENVKNKCFLVVGSENSCSKPLIHRIAHAFVQHQRRRNNTDTDTDTNTDTEAVVYTHNDQYKMQCKAFFHVIDNLKTLIFAQKDKTRENNLPHVVLIVNMLIPEEVVEFDLISLIYIAKHLTELNITMLLCNVDYGMHRYAHYLIRCIDHSNINSNDYSEFDQYAGTIVGNTYTDTILNVNTDAQLYLVDLINYESGFCKLVDIPKFFFGEGINDIILTDAHSPECYISHVSMRVGDIITQCPYCVAVYFPQNIREWNNRQHAELKSCSCPYCRRHVDLRDPMYLRRISSIP